MEAMAAVLVQYDRFEKIGEGTYGVVYKAIDRHTGATAELKRCLGRCRIPATGGRVAC